MIFGTTPGTVGKAFAIAGASVPAIISVPGFPSGTVAITSAGLSQDANVQFMTALSKVIYIYSFGERMGTVDINGVAFVITCPTGGVTTVSGLVSLMSFYKANSVSTRAYPLTVSLGGVAVSGFVKSVRTTFSDSQLGLTGFTLSMATLPGLW